MSRYNGGPSVVTALEDITDTVNVLNKFIEINSLLLGGENSSTIFVDGLLKLKREPIPESGGNAFQFLKVGLLKL